jgi:tetratricopeptide (TPR) repeat protein
MIDLRPEDVRTYISYRGRFAPLRALATAYFALGFVGLGLAAVRPGDVSPVALPALGLALLLAGTSMSVGALLGALFGIPRSLPTAPSTPDHPGSSSLETIADWLTKMLIGAALVSLPQLPSLWRDLAHASDLDPLGPPGIADRLGILVVCYFGLGGFLAGYLAVRLQFASTSLRQRLLDESFNIALDFPLGPRGGAVAPLSLDDLRAINRLAATPQQALRNNIERRAWAKAQVISGTGNLDGAVEAYRQVVAGSPDPVLVFEFADLLDHAGRSAEAQNFREQAAKLLREGGELAPEQIIQKVFRALYRKGGYAEAIELGEPLAQRVLDVRLWVYLACAYGQKHADLKERGASADELGLARGRALYCVKQALGLDSTWLRTLRALWDPNAIRPGDDDDLVTFYDDPEFRAILDPDSLAVTQSATLAQDIQSGIESALAPASLVEYMGHVAFAVTARSGKALPLNPETSAPMANPGSACRFVVRVVPGPAREDSQGTSIPLEVPGEKRPEATFEFRTDSPDIRFSPDIMSVRVQVDAPTPDIDFAFDAPRQPGAYEFWVEVSQARRTVQMIQARLEVAAPAARRRPGKDVAG